MLKWNWPSIQPKKGLLYIQIQTLPLSMHHKSKYIPKFFCNTNNGKLRGTNSWQEGGFEKGRDKFGDDYSPIGSLEILTCNSSDLRFDCMTFATHPLGHKRHPKKESFLAKLLGSLPLINVSDCMQHCLPKSCINPIAPKYQKMSSSRCHPQLHGHNNGINFRMFQCLQASFSFSFSSLAHWTNSLSWPST